MNLCASVESTFFLAIPTSACLEVYLEDQDGCEKLNYSIKSRNRSMFGGCLRRLRSETEKKINDSELDTSDTRVRSRNRINIRASVEIRPTNSIRSFKLRAFMKWWFTVL